MTKADYHEFAKQMMVLAEVYEKNPENVSEQKVEIYFRALSKFPIDDIVRAVELVIQRRVYDRLPKPAELIQAILGTEEDRALRAWVQLDEAVKHIGPYESVQFADSTIHSVVEHWGGWPAICSICGSEWKWRQKDFGPLYRMFSGRSGAPAYLVGETEAKNRGKFPKSVKDPVRVGFDGQKLLK